MRMLFLLLAARSGAGVAGSELLQRREWPRGVVLGLSRGRDHYAVLAAAHGAASAETEPQQRLQAVQHNASGLSGAMRRLAGLCDGADPWARDAQSARVPVAESAWLARSAKPKAFPAFWALPRSAQYLCCADGRPRCGLPRVAWEPPVGRSLVNTAARARRGCCTTSGEHGRALDRVPAPNFDYRLPPEPGAVFLNQPNFITDCRAEPTAPPPPTGPPPYGPARNNLGDPGPPRRRLTHETILTALSGASTAALSHAATTVGGVNSAVTWYQL
ncbi:hypothetical protein EMIHUDRAFT_198743 [Emiliania huxleyi CCMP1516]|uniref:Uncharacterized protein n=2 Tax=Emiliania huxleyi TaxID=2903 RepID=A0A0D3I7S7_EMIH1|nr:hypothetical protein EMIHUDRAFT_198743 [Emiliania huxleyi CCMP1516]EOD07312.1 hypothetical protein EMIHUDRAFT_198743 [Emiliania huxleyi CCMP1516]|eukprot:XP_005759741.1 hypothetical protein EMIHUDRAFT_198743 [Emiliania huxleyi CCMP1516]